MRFKSVRTCDGSGSLQMVSGPDTRLCASEDIVPQGSKHETVCLRTLAPKGVDLAGAPHRLEKRKSASEEVGPRRGWIMMSHIGWERRTKLPL